MFKNCLCISFTHLNPQLETMSRLKYPTLPSRYKPVSSHERSDPEVRVPLDQTSCPSVSGMAYLAVCASIVSLQSRNTAISTAALSLLTQSLPFAMEPRLIVTACDSVTGATTDYLSALNFRRWVSILKHLEQVQSSA